MWVMTLLYLVRHGQTEWSKSGQHTSFTDLDLTEHGVKQATALRERLDPSEFGLVLTSPRMRARKTAELAGFTDYEVTDDLQEWNYGDYEGKTSAQIREDHHGWRLWFNGVPNGETADQVRERLTRVVHRVRASGVDKAICFGQLIKKMAKVSPDWIVDRQRRVVIVVLDETNSFLKALPRLFVKYQLQGFIRYIVL